MNDFGVNMNMGTIPGFSGLGLSGSSGSSGLFSGLGGAIGSALTSGIAGGIGALPGAALGMGLSALSERRQYKNQKKLMKYQYDLQKQQFDYVSEYNSPLKQMERLTSAGLNPNLVYGNGATAEQGATGSVGSGSAPKIDYSDAFAAALGQLQQGINTQLNAATIENLKAQNENLHTQNLLLKSQERKTSLDADYQSWNLDFQRSIERFRWQEAENDAMMSTWNWWNTRDYSSKQIIKGLDKLDADIDYIRSNTDKSIAEIGEIFSRVVLNDAKVREIASVVRLNDAKVREIGVGIYHTLFSDTLNSLDWIFNKYGKSDVAAVLNAVGRLFGQKDINGIIDELNNIYDKYSDSVK